MPWALHADPLLILSARPQPQHLDKYGWEDIAMVSLCNSAPHHSIITDDRVQWWVHIPFADGSIRDLHQIIRARDTVLSMMQKHRTTIVHCMAGRNRSGLVGALVIRELKNMTGTEAMAWTRRCRPLAIDNVHFEVFLDSLDRPHL